MGGYLCLRIACWVVGIFVAVFPTLFAVGVPVLVWPLLRAATVINQKGEFRDVLFVLVVAGSLGISVIVDFLYSSGGKGPPAEWLRTTTILLLIANMFVICGGLVGFVVLPSHGLIDASWLADVVIGVLMCLVVGLATEVVVSAANHSYR
jgi:hypothetical protein